MYPLKKPREENEQIIKQKDVQLFAISKSLTASSPPMRMPKSHLLVSHHDQSQEEKDLEGQIVVCYKESRYTCKITIHKHWVTRKAGQSKHKDSKVYIINQGMLTVLQLSSSVCYVARPSQNHL